MENTETRKRNAVIKAVICDGQPMRLQGLNSLARSHPGIALSGEARCGAELVELCALHQPDLAAFVLPLPDSSAPTLLRDLRSARPGLLALVISEHEDAPSILRCFHAGAHGYLSVKDDLSYFGAAVDEVLQGRFYVSPRISSAVLLQALKQKTSRCDKTDLLSNREYDVFKLSAVSKGPSMIAQQLKISVKTVETHQQHIKKKLGLSSCTELRELAELCALETAPQELMAASQRF